VDDTDRIRYVYRVTSLDYDWRAPLAQLLDRDPPAYGARYAPATDPDWREARWECHTCGDVVTDRYWHEATYHRAPWFAELATLHATVVALFGSGPVAPPHRDGDDRS
jgi:hypothetical protein